MKLTAEQVRKAVFNGSVYASYDGTQYYASGIGMQAIADELNAILGDNGCGIEWRDESHDTDAGHERDGAYFCTACKADLPYPLQECWDDYQAGNGEKPFDCCPNCGKEIRR